jgi:hypothetical protein
LHEPCTPHYPSQSGKGLRGKMRAMTVFLRGLREILRTMPWGVNANQDAVRVSS